MQSQNFQNHSTLKTPTKTFVFYVAGSFFLFLVASANMVSSIVNVSGRTTAAMLLLISMLLIVAYFLFRSFSIKAQDRAIRAEENLRHFVLCGKLLDPKLSIYQIIALRFAPDEEFLELAQKAVNENLSQTDIKKSIKNWKADFHRA